MPADANEQWISDKLICIQMFVSLVKYDLQETPEQSQQGPRMESRPGFWSPLCHQFALGTWVNCSPSLGFSKMRWLNK